MNAPDSITKPQPGRLAAIFACCAVLALAGCGKDEAPKTAGSNSKAGAKTTATAPAADETTAPATAEATAVSAGQLDFFTERYISAEERLARRQQRIEEELAGGSPAGPG